MKQWHDPLLHVFILIKAFYLIKQIILLVYSWQLDFCQQHAALCAFSYQWECEGLSGCFQWHYFIFHHGGLEVNSRDFILICQEYVLSCIWLDNAVPWWWCHVCFIWRPVFFGRSTWSRWMFLHAKLKGVWTQPERRWVYERRGRQETHTCTVVVEGDWTILVWAGEARRTVWGACRQQGGRKDDSMQQQSMMGNLIRSRYSLKFMWGQKTKLRGKLCFHTEAATNDD